MHDHDVWMRVLDVHVYIVHHYNSLEQVLFLRTTRREAPMQREALPRGCARRERAA